MFNLMDEKIFTILLSKLPEPMIMFLLSFYFLQVIVQLSTVVGQGWHSVIIPVIDVTVMPSAPIMLMRKTAVRYIYH